MSLTINPQQIKRREYLGLGGLIFGLISVLAGAVSLLFLIPLGLTVIGLGSALVAAGIFILDNIPDVIALGDDRF